MDIFNILFEIFFPKNEITLLYDKIDSDMLEKLATRTFIDMESKYLAPFPYNKKLIRDAIYASKYNSHKRASVLLGEILYPYITEEIANKRMFETFINIIIIPIPLHKKRLHERGFNQTERIAKSLLKQLNDKNIVLNTDILIRNKNTKSQAQSKNKNDRFKNMKNAFFVQKPKEILGQDIILLDDVITTGATLSTAKNILKDAGAKNILCVAVAH